MHMRSPVPSSWCAIHPDRISRNLEIALGLLPKESGFCAVLKSDAYGHGIDTVVPLVTEQGVACIGITSNVEAYAVRAAGFSGRLLRLRAATPDEIEEAAHWAVEEQVGSVAAAQAILQSAETKAHLSLNVQGMSRDALELGVTGGQDISDQIFGLLGDRIVGVSTHFASNDPVELAQSNVLFRQQVDWVIAASGRPRSELLVHAGSSLTLVSGVDIDTDMYRCGAILYGILRPDLGFRPSMHLNARVLSVTTYPQGASVGYDRGFRLERTARLASISVGYADGFRRNAFGQAMVMIRGQVAPVIGKMSMNTIVADVSDIADVQVADVACVSGVPDDDPKAIAQWEQQFGTIAADLFVDWGLRNPRICM